MSKHTPARGRALLSCSHLSRRAAYGSNAPRRICIENKTNFHATEYRKPDGKVHFIGLSERSGQVRGQRRGTPARITVHRFYCYALLRLEPSLTRVTDRTKRSKYCRYLSAGDLRKGTPSSRYNVRPHSPFVQVVHSPASVSQISLLSDFSLSKHDGFRPTTLDSRT